MVTENCAICGCVLHREKGTYALATPKGRSHATEHHLVPERFFGRSGNRRGTKKEGVFETCPWGFEGKTELFCYECHEELMHNPVFLPEDVRGFAQLVRLRGLHEDSPKSESRSKIAGRVKLLQEIITEGIKALELKLNRGVQQSRI